MLSDPLMIREADFRAVVQKNLKSFRMLHIAMAMGVTILFGLTLALAYAGAKPLPVLPAPLEMIRWFTYVHLFVAIGCYMLHAFIPAMVMAAQPVKTAEDLHSRILTARIIQLVLLEGPALVGMVICLLGVRNGALTLAPIYWINLVTTVVFYIRLLRIFPNEEKLMAIQRETLR